MVIFTHTFTAELNQNILEDRHYFDLPSDTQLILDILEQWVADNGIGKTTNYNEDTSSLDVIFISSEENFQLFLSFMNSLVDDYESWFNNFAIILKSIGFNYTRKIETIPE